VQHPQDSLRWPYGGPHEVSSFELEDEGTASNESVPIMLTFSIKKRVERIGTKAGGYSGILPPAFASAALPLCTPSFVRTSPKNVVYLERTTYPELKRYTPQP
jgi:hypothetical protein